MMREQAALNASSSTVETIVKAFEAEKSMMKLQIAQLEGRLKEAEATLKKVRDAVNNQYGLTSPQFLGGLQSGVLNAYQQILANQEESSNLCAKSKS